MAVARLTSSQAKRCRVVSQTVSATEFAADAAHFQNVFRGFFLDDLDDIVCGDDADQPLIRIDHRRRSQIVALELPRHLFLVGLDLDRVNVGDSQVFDRDQPLGAQQAIERHRPQQMIGRVDDEDFVKPLGQVVGLLHKVEGLPHRPERRHRDQVGLHDAAGRVLFIFEASLQCRALKQRQLGQDVRLFLLVEVLEQIDGFVGIELLQRFRNLLVRHRLQHLVAHRLVEFRERRSIELGSQCGDQRDPLLGLQ